MKRLLALLLIVVMITPLVACSGNNSEYTTLNCIFLGKTPNNNDLALVQEEMNKITREKLGVELNITIMDAGTMAEKLNVMMGSGEQIDIVWTGYAFDYARCVRNGGLYDITELVAQTPGITENIPDYVMNQCYVDGKLYGVANMQTMSSYWCYVFPKEFVDKYNFDYTQVTCHEDLEPYLEALVQNEPDVYPICDENIMGSWTEKKVEGQMYFEPFDNVCVNAETGEISLPMDLENYVNRWERAQEWYGKGYIRKDIMTVTDYESVKVSKQTGVWCTSGKPGLAEELTDRYGYEVVTVPSNTPVLSNPTGNMMCVGANTVDALKSLQVIELLNNDSKFHNLAVFGVEGTHYKLNADGKVEMVDKAGYDQSAYSWAYGNQFIGHLMSYQADDLWEETKRMNDAAQPNIDAGFAIPGDVQDQIKTEVALLSALGGEYADGLRYGTFEDLDTVLEEYKDRALDMFYEIKDVIQPYVDEWMESKEQ